MLTYDRLFIFRLENQNETNKYGPLRSDRKYDI
jgi:hypothetical protein